MIRNFFLFVVSLMVTFFAANIVFAKTFFDNFDDQTFTSNNWQEITPTWSFVTIDNSTTLVDYGFRGEYVDDNAMAYADNGALFSYLTLFIRVELSIQKKEIYEDGTNPKDEGGTIGFIESSSGRSIRATLLYSDTDGWLHAAGIGTNDGDQIEKSITGIDYDRFYYLDLAVDKDGILTSNLYDDAGRLISTITESNAPILSNGVVGILSDADTIFDKFSANDGQIDEDVAQQFYQDRDGDGYGNANVQVSAIYSPPGYVNNNTDCNDNDHSISPDASEIDNDIDDNCNGQIDEGFSDGSTDTNSSDGGGGGGGCFLSAW
jgi:hypothetical protein